MLEYVYCFDCEMEIVKDLKMMKTGFNINFPVATDTPYLSYMLDTRNLLCKVTPLVKQYTLNLYMRSEGQFSTVSTIALNGYKMFYVLAILSFLFPERKPVIQKV